ncbi:G-patch domain-containing protein [Besnoitia besnoiti]|uniref:G-patch domain-containing protein n=1 Tax=Besnoitia besnoiti TaxID=94643 RepID=A0A2A9M063_BESBE|nr:G-patch domain-containing protein [Besnoitia besnoiti]PFH31365.1 G-patch domain-containing protein [Besnoitia besnoiti]
MSKKFYDRVLKGSGVQSRPFHSSFGAAILKKFGWEEGQGLGRENSGRTDCLQIRRREENVGLGHSDSSDAKGEEQWRNWWDGLYNSMAAKLKDNHAVRAGNDPGSSDSDSSDDERDAPPSLGKFRGPSLMRVSQKLARHKEAAGDGDGSESSSSSEDGSTAASASLSSASSLSSSRDREAKEAEDEAADRRKAEKKRKRKAREHDEDAGANTPCAAEEARSEKKSKKRRAQGLLEGETPRSADSGECDEAARGDFASEKKKKKAPKEKERDAGNVAEAADAEVGCGDVEKKKNGRKKTRESDS